MATKNNTPKINVPAPIAPVAPTQENTQVPAPVEVSERTQATQAPTNDVEASTQVPAPNAAPVAPTDSAQAPNADSGSTDAPAPAPVVTLDEIDAFTPDAINAAIAEIEANHATVTKLVGKLPDAALQATRVALNITDDLDADKQKIMQLLGGNVASIIDALRADDETTWKRVGEYIDLEHMLTDVNATREKLGLGSLVLRVVSANSRGRSSGSTDSGSGSTRNSTGYMRPMTIAHTYKDQDVVWTASRENIAVTVNKRVIYSGAQGAISLSKIMEKVLLACGAAPDSRQNLPAWFRAALHKSGSTLDVDTEVMLRSQEQVNAIADKLVTPAPAPTK